MRNITLSVPEDVYLAARVVSAQRGQSLSALVADHLRSLTDRAAEFSRLEALQDRVLSEIVEFRAGDRVSRDEVHDRALR